MSLRNGEFTRNQGAGNTIDPCRPLFYEESVQSGERDGRPTYKMVERVKVIMPGNGNTMPVFNVTDEFRDRWPKEYEDFKNKIEPSLNGTPLEEWSILNKARVMELKAMEIRTIEDVASLPDTIVQRIGRGGYALRERAQAFMDESKETALLDRVTGENEAMREQIGILARQVEEMGTMLESQQKQIHAAGDAPSAVSTIVPGSMDINERNKPTHIAEDNSSSFDNLAPVRRKPGRPKANAA